MSLVPAAAEFHPRFDALSRTYEYRVWVSPLRDPLRRRRWWRVPRELDLGLMCKAAESLLGKHDFATFGQPTHGSSTVRQVHQASWLRQTESDYRFTIKANAFLYRMVRNLVGTLVAVGQGDLSVDEFEAALAARDRRHSRPPAPPHGLTLMAVEYEEEE
ncbi:MAG: tRNA pseudouridine synthase A [Chloroflexi bacterium]|nr:tRNA pseudouridine synthase A [Chloroflexota bacterium]